LKKILITGINGFIGSNCANYFSKEGYELFGIDILGENSSKFVQGEVNIENLKSFNQKFDIIIHLAGSGTVGVAQKYPELEYSKTVGSTEHILEYLKLYNQNAKLIYSSSAAVYGDLYNRPIKETDILNPISIYGRHKVEAETMCEEYHKKFGLNINIIRFFSIYGEGLKKQLLWDFSNRMRENFNQKFLNCFGSGKEERDYIHIGDVVAIINLLINAEKDFTVLNCGSGKNTKIRDILNLIINEQNYKGELFFDNIIREGDPTSLTANIEKAKLLGFNPKITLEDGISRYVEWFKQNN